MPWAYEAYEAYEPNFRENVVNAFHRLRLLLPPSADGPPPSKREVLGEGNRELAECRRARDALTPSTVCGRGTRSARPRGLGGNFDLPRSKVATGLLPFAWDAPPR